jgi:hypothetical protein
MSSFSKIIPGLFNKVTKTVPLWALILIALIAVVVVYFSYKSTIEGFTSSEEIDLGERKKQLAYTDVSGIQLKKGFHFYPTSGHILRNVQNDDNTSKQYLLYSRVPDSNNNVLEASLNIVNPMPTGSNLAISGDLTDSYRSWQVDSTQDATGQLFLIPYATNTFIHVVDADAGKLYSYYSNPNSNGGDIIDEVVSDISDEAKEADGTNYQSFTSGTKTHITFTNGESELKLDRDTYHVAQNVYFDQGNGDLYIKGLTTDNSHNITIYPRNYQEILQNSQEAMALTGGDVSQKNTRKTIGHLNVSAFENSFMVEDKEGNNLVLYLCAGTNRRTVIAILHKNINNQYDLVNVKRFDGSSVITAGSFSGGEDEGEGDDIDLEDENEDEGEGEDSDYDRLRDTLADSMEEYQQGRNGPESMDDYYKWYWYWNTADSMPVHFSEDYMLKTQMVPPVCPACPACPGAKEGGCCTNCGGNGGSGTKDEKGGSVVSNGNPVGDAYGKTLDTGSDLLKSGGSGAVNLTRDVVGLGAAGAVGTAGMAKDTVTGAAGLAKDTVTGTVGLAKDTVTGTVDLAKDTVGGTADFVKGLGSGAVQMSKNLNNDGRTGYYGSPSYNQSSVGTYGSQITGQIPKGPADPYTYNGTLKQKPPSKFMPITADFSAFAK